MTAAKSVWSGRAAPYLGVSYSEWEETLIFPAGINFVLAPTLDFLCMHDGRRTHALVTFKQRDTNITIMAVDLKKPRLGVSVGWGLK